MGLFMGSIGRAKLGFVQLIRRVNQVKDKKLENEDIVYLLEGVDKVSDLFSDAGLIRLNKFLQKFKRIIKKNRRITREADDELAYIRQNLEEA